MLREVHNVLHVTRLRLTASEMTLLVVAAGLSCASFTQLVDTPLHAGVMLLAAAAIVALVYERSNTRQMIRILSERLNSVAFLDKCEVGGSADIVALDQALNRLVQRTRSQVQNKAEPVAEATEATADQVGEAHMVAVLSIGVRQGAVESFSPEHLEHVIQTATKALQYDADSSLLIQMQGDGTVLLACGAERPQPVVLSLRQTLSVAQALSDDARLRFGLSCGAARICTIAQRERVLVGTPMEEASRLYRMAAAWHEHDLLCTEPVALLARTFPSHRTDLKLTHIALPALPVYSVDLELAYVAKSA